MRPASSCDAKQCSAEKVYKPGVAPPPGLVSGNPSPGASTGGAARGPILRRFVPGLDHSLSAGAYELDVQCEHCVR